MQIYADIRMCDGTIKKHRVNGAGLRKSIKQQASEEDQTVIKAISTPPSRGSQ